MIRYALGEKRRHGVANLRVLTQELLIQPILTH
jgi:hypothetical protein